MNNFTISDKATLRDALIVLDNKHFCVVVDTSDKVVGILDERMICKAFVRGKCFDDTVADICVEMFPYICINDSVEKIIELLKDETVYYWPVVDSNRRLLNVVTKNILYVRLLQNDRLNFWGDFVDRDFDMCNYEIHQRPWGFYKTMWKSKFFQSKIINVKPHGQLSLQSHIHREEYWIVVNGTGVAQVDDKEILLEIGRMVFIPKESKHRLINSADKGELQIVEVQLGSYFGEDDIIRYEDIYGRV